MAGELILITGATGFIGYRVLIEALRKGYKVRVAVRSEAKFESIKSVKASQQYLSNLSYIVVPDITEDGAFDEAVKGVDYVVHVASPLARGQEDFEKDIVQPAIHGTLSILYSTLKEPSIKRVVITSSVLASVGTEQKIYTADDVLPTFKGPYDNAFNAYWASKANAYNATTEFIQKQKPKYDVIHVKPTFVVGRNDLAKTTTELNTGSNAIPLTSVLGVNHPTGYPAMTCSVDDVAYVHIAALDPKISGNHDYGVNVDGLNGIKWDDALDIVQKHFPNQVASGIFPLGGSNPSHAIKFDCKATEEALGFKFKSFEQQIIDLAGQYAELAAVN